MFFCSHTPRQPLARFIDNFWLYQGYTSVRQKELIFPDGTFKLVFNLERDEFRIYNPTHTTRYTRFSGAIVSRPSGHRFVTDAAEESSVLGVNFRLGGALPFLGSAGAEGGDRHVDLREIAGSQGVEFQQRLSAASRPAERFRLLEEWLLAWLSRRRSHHHPAVLFALERLGRPHGPGTCELARAAGLSERRFIGVFKAEMAVTPKLFSRVRRFQRARSLMRRERLPEWASLAAECGYYDQSHLIHDFEAFAGLTPREYLRRHDDLVRRRVYVKRNHLPLLE